MDRGSQGSNGSYAEWPLAGSNPNAKQTPGTGIGQKPTAKKLPDRLSFYFSVETVDLNRNDPAAYATSIPGHGDWVPPRSKSALIGSGETWYRWDRGTTTQLTEFDLPQVKPHLELYEEATMMHDDGYEKLWLIPMDAKTTNVSDLYGEGADWKSMSFVQKEDPDGIVYSWVGYMGGSARLPVPASSSWDDQLIPDMPYGWRDEYGYKSANSRSQPQPGNGLCGSISVLLCLAAFSCPEHELTQTLKDSFKYREWVRHARVHDRNGKKGKIARVFSDPWNPAMSKTVFKDIGQGNYGPVFV
ncbi:MAG: hypothetical protein M1824_004038 [Vezdaea acicularis]|nr:MAG: hypothetical protein M1824_004038 [Vezdaea acicularis]